MQTNSTSGIEFQLGKTHDRAGTPVTSAGNGMWALYILLLIPGISLSLLALDVYPPLDFRLLMLFAIGLFFLPIAVERLIIVRTRPSGDLRALRTVYIYSSLALVLLALLFYLNGRLDRSPVNEVRTTITRKTVYRGRRGDQYRLFVSSWRPGRNTENFKVNMRVFNRAVVGKTATLELHKGFFGLPWYSNLSPE